MSIKDGTVNMSNLAQRNVRPLASSLRSFIWETEDDGLGHEDIYVKLLKLGLIQPKDKQAIKDYVLRERYQHNLHKRKAT